MSPPSHRSIESEERATDERIRSPSVVLFSFALGASWLSLLARRAADEKRDRSLEIQWEARAWPPVVGRRDPGSALLRSPAPLLPPPPLPPRANAREVSRVAAAAPAILANVARGDDEPDVEPSSSERSRPTEAASEERDQEAAEEAGEGEGDDDEGGGGGGEAAAAAAVAAVAETASAG